MKIRSVIVIALMLVALLLVNPYSSGYAKPALAESPQTVQGPLLCAISEPDFVSFPTVKLNFRMLDVNLLPIIPDGELRFAENGNTPVPALGGAQRNPEGIGLNFYVVVDKGNRSPQTDVREILQDLTQYHNEKLDSIRIYTNEKNVPVLYYPGTVANTLAQAVANFPIEPDSEKRPRSIQGSLDATITEVESSIDPCQTPRIIIVIAGDDTIEKKRILEYGKRIKDSNAKLVFFHLRGENSSFESRDIYSELANHAGGIYQQVLALDNDIKPILDQISLYRQSFSATYRSNFGAKGLHNISALYQGINIPIQGKSSYAIDIQPPLVTLSGLTYIDRVRSEDAETQTVIYSHDSELYNVNIIWQDSYPRNLTPNAKLIIQEDGKTPETVDVTLQDNGDGTYRIAWNFSGKQDIREYKVDLAVKVTDEFGTSGRSEPLAVVLNVSAGETPVTSTMKYILYGLIGLVLLLILLMIFGFIFFRSQMRSVASRGGAIVGKIAGEIRKTLVGGGQRGKPLATLKVLEGPPTMIGQELKIYTDSVKLGRNPQLADMTFYGPDILTSVSGLHARLEKVSGYWRIVALSQSHSETFLDEQPIPFHEPTPISEGQKIRMGYPAQQPVVLIFSPEKTGMPRTTLVGGDSDPRRTDVSVSEVEEKTAPLGSRITPQKQDAITSGKAKPKETDSIFDEFR